MSKKDITVGGHFAQPGQRGSNTIVLTQPKRFGLGIDDMINAINAAERVDFPLRSNLYDLYTSILQDSHLTSVIEKREDALLSTEFQFVRDGKPVDEINDIINTRWFRNFVIDVIGARWWGFSLLQFHLKKGKITYDLIPRKHVNPISKQILRYQTDLTGMPLDSFRHLLFIGGERDMGKLFKAAPWVLYKRNDAANWVEFADIFGMPIRDYTYPSGDDQARQQALSDSQESGSAQIFIHSEDTNLELKESGNKSGTVDVFDKLFDKCNNELSKLFLGNTLTTEATNKGTQALGVVHQSEEDKKEKSDIQYILDVLNDDMPPIFAAMGVNTDGGKFIVPKRKVQDQKTRADVLNSLHNTFGLEISEDFLYEEFNIDKPVGATAKKQEPKQEPKEEPTPDDTKGKREPKQEPKPTLASRVRGFFAPALGDDRADHLDW